MSQDIDFSQYKRKNQTQQPRDPLFEFNPQQQEEIDFSQYKRKPERSLAEKGGRLAMQAGLAGAERAGLGYELAVAPLASKEAQTVPYRQGVFEDIERLQEQKATGVWDKQDEEMLQNLTEQIRNPEKAQQFVKTADIGVRGLVHKATGIDTHPEGALEKAVSWTSFLKNPANAKNLIRAGVQPKEIIKAIIPGQKSLRGLTAGTALQMAEDEKFGPLGTIGAAVVGDILGHTTKGTVKALLNPKQTLAKGAAMLANRKGVIKKELEEASQGKNFTKDLGTLTDNRIIQMVQARLSASGLVGKPLEELRKTMINEIVQDYESIVNELGEARFNTLTEAGEAGKDMLTSLRNEDRELYRSLFDESREAAKGERLVFESPELSKKIDQLIEKLTPGALKSPETQKVLDTLNKLKSDLLDESGKLKPASVEEMLNNKQNLNDIIDYDVQGGSKQLLKGVVADIDEALKRYGAVSNPRFGKAYHKANKQFQKHAQDFRNDNINKILMSDDPMILMNKMNTIQGIRDLKRALSRTPQGKELFNSLARKKIDMIFGDNFNEGLKDQLKFGKFSNAFMNPRNREILSQLLPKESFKRLVNLQKHVGELQETAQKFFNASQSATAGADLAAIGSVISGIAGLITGNPWAITAAALVGGSRVLSGLMGDPKFLKLVEESIIAARKNDIGLMNRIAQNMKPILQENGIAATLTAKGMQSP